MNVRERWESKNPLADVVYFGHGGVCSDMVFAMFATGQNMLSLAVGRSYLCAKAISTAHLICLVDRTPRVANGSDPDMRVFLDGGQALDIESGTVRRSHLPGAWSSIVRIGDQRRRCLVSSTSVQEILWLREDGEDFRMISLPNDDRECEVWPEFRHNR